MTSPPAAALYECLEAVASAIFVLRDGLILWANSAAASLAASETALSGQRLEALLAPETRTRAAQGGEVEFVTARGASVWATLALRSAKIDGQHVEIATATNIHSGKAATNSLSDREAIYRRTIENSHEGFYLLKCRYDADGQVADFVYEDVNAEGEVLSGPKERLLGHGMRELFPENIVRDHWYKYLQVLQSGKVLDEEYETHRVDGTPRWFHHQIVPTDQGVAIFTRDITERKQTESALRESERRYQALLNQSNDCVSLLDMDGYFLLVNEQFVKRLGYTVEEMIGRHVSEVILPGEVAHYRKVDDELKLGQDVPLFERLYVCRDGTVFPGEVNISFVRDADGQPMYVQSIMRDIGWRKEAEQALRESEERYRIISELISDYAYSFRIEPDGTPVSEWITESFKRITGYTPEEIDAQGQFALYYPGEGARVAADMDRALAGEAGSSEYRIVTKSGEVHWVNIYRKPVWDEKEGRVVRLYGVAQDITKRKESEEELRQSEEEYRLIAENATDMITRTTDEDVRIYASPASRALLGYEPEEIIGPNSSNLMHPDDIPVMEAAWTAIGKTPNPVTFIARLRHKNGEYRWFEVTGRTVLDPETGAIKEYLALSRDISHRIQMDTILSEQQRLRYELQKEQELNEVKSNLMRTISHEFRTPLALILTSTDFLDTYLDRLDPQKRKDRLQGIRIQIKRLGDMLDDISFVVQGTLHHMIAHPSPMNLELYCRTIMDEIETTIGRNHRFAFTSDGTLTDGSADKALVMRILTNLLSNAIKYSPENSVITVALFRSENDAVLQVSDRGIGISPEEQKRIFEPFYRSTSVLDSVGGTGLGLSIVKDCVNLHGGTISVESVLNQGTTFTVRLPQATE